MNKKRPESSHLITPALLSIENVGIFLQLTPSAQALKAAISAHAICHISSISRYGSFSYSHLSSSQL
jgi:hypothetical protein